MVSQWFHWRERFPERCDLRNVKMQTINNVDTTNLSFQLSLDLSLSDGSSCADIMELENSRGFFQMNLVWDIKSTQGSADIFVHEIKLENCAIKISMDSVEGDEHFSKWLHLDPSGNEKTGSWKDFIPKAKLGQLTLDNEKKSRAVSWEIVVFGRIYVRAWWRNSAIPNNRIFDNVSVFQTNKIPCHWSSFDSGASTVTLTIHKKAQEEVVANKYVLAACSPVLRKMLFETNNMGEKATGHIILEDTSFHALKTFIGLISGDKAIGMDIVKMSIYNIHGVLDLAHKYQVDGIIDLCIMIAMAKKDSEMEVAEVHHLFQVGKLYNIPDLCTRSFEWICKSALKWNEILGFLEKEASDLLSEYCYYFTMRSMG